MSALPGWDFYRDYTEHHSSVTDRKGRYSVIRGSAIEINLRERTVGQVFSALGERRLHLAALNAAVSQSGEGLSCGLVSRAGAPPVLSVVSRADKFRTMDVGCERVGGVWWFVRADTGEGLVPVLEVEDAPALLARLVERSADGGSGSESDGEGRT